MDRSDSTKNDQALFLKNFFYPYYTVHAEKDLELFHRKFNIYWSLVFQAVLYILLFFLEYYNPFHQQNPKLSINFELNDERSL